MNVLYGYKTRSNAHVQAVVIHYFHYHSDTYLYLCEAQLGCMNGAGTLFSSWMMVSLSVEIVRTLEP